MYNNILQLKVLKKKIKLNEIYNKKNNLQLNPYEQLFSNMGIIEPYKNEWLKLVSKEDRPCYRLIKFQLSDSLSYLSFKKYEEYIREKIGVYKLEVDTVDSMMCFRIIKEKFPVMNYQFKSGSKCLLPLGYDLDNELTMLNLCSDPNILIGGVPTCGKTTLLHVIISHIIENEMGLLWLIDLKAGLEFGRYKQLKQLRGYAQDLEPSKAIVKSFNAEMERRFKILEKANIQKYEDYIVFYPKVNMPRAFLIIDEFTDLMQLIPKGKGKETHYNIIDNLVIIGRKARCVGMHLILSSQGLNATSLDPNIKRVCSAVVGFRAVNSINSQVVIDESGLENLQNYQAMVRKEGSKTFIRTMKMDMGYLKKVITTNENKNVSIQSQKVETDNIFV